jgi:hypothetical protein
MSRTAPLSLVPEESSIAQFSETLIRARIEATIAILSAKHNAPPELVREILSEAADIIVHDLEHTSFWTHVWLVAWRACRCCCTRVPSRVPPVLV